MNRSYLAALPIFFFLFFMWLKKKHLLKIFLPRIKSKVAIKFLKESFFFSAENWLKGQRLKATERVKLYFQMR